MERLPRHSRESVRHYGAERAGADEVGKAAAGADIVLTTYGTAVRDTDALASVKWNYVVVDEAQTIKNPASDTASPSP